LVTINAVFIRGTIEEPKKFFISYKNISGKIIALQLYKYLKDCNIDVFISDRDIQFDITKGEWSKQIDDALAITKVFILIITTTASTSDDIKREFNFVKNDNSIGKYIFILDTIWDDEKQTTFVFVDGTSRNLKDYPAQIFRDGDDLVNKVYKCIPYVREIQFHTT